jgi:nucleoside-diphosphate-sugar epimerase
MKGTVAVTGASGFVGQALVEQLLASGWGVRALVHRQKLPSSLHSETLQTVHGSLGDETALHALLAGVDAVVHVAGRVRGRTEEDFRQVNAAGVERLTRAALAESRPLRFILISSLAAREPGLSPYAASKREGEVLLTSLAKGSALSCAILRPPAVYGPGDEEMAPLFKAMAWGVAPILGAAGARASLIHVNDLASAILALLDSEATGTYEIHDGRPEGYSWDDIATTVEGVVGRGRGWRLRVPAALLRGWASANLFAARIFGYQPMLTPGKVNELRHPNWVCDNTEFSRATGWQPAVTLREGLPGILKRARPRTDEGISDVE